MIQNLKRIWAYLNSILLLISIIVLWIWPGKIFVIGNTQNTISAIVLLGFASTGVMLLYVFISFFSFVQSKKRYQGNSIFYLLGSFLSLILLMVVKVMSDEIAHEWIQGSMKIVHMEEFWLLNVALVIIMCFMIFLGLTNNKIKAI